MEPGLSNVQLGHLWHYKRTKRVGSVSGGEDRKRLAWKEGTPGGQAGTGKKPRENCEGLRHLGQVWTTFQVPKGTLEGVGNGVGSGRARSDLSQLTLRQQQDSLGQ